MNLLVGLILFMGAVTGEANHQPHVSKGELQTFRYSYASSFYMLNLAFCLDEISGVLSVYLFIIRHKETVKRRHARLNAHKSKANRMQNYFKRRSSRLHSMSSVCGETSRLSSDNSPLGTRRTTNHPANIDHDISHGTILTVVGSQDLHCPRKSSLRNKHGVMEVVIENNHVDNHCQCNGVGDNSSPVLPPKEFQTSNYIRKEDNNNDVNHMTKFQTTSV